MNTPVAIAAASEIKPGKYPELGAYDLYIEVVKKFLEDWDVRPSDIDGLLACPAGMATGEYADIFVHEQLYEELGLQPSFAETINAGGATHGLMVQRAVMAIQLGLADSVLCISAGKFPKVSAGGAEAMARMVSHEAFEFPYGTFIPAIYAQTASRHMYEYGTSVEQIAQVAVSCREWALLNPDALTAGKGSITVEDVRNSRLIATPFNMLDCSIPCEGGGALLVANGKLAKKINSQPAYIVGMGEHHNHCNISQAPNLLDTGSRTSADKAYRMAGVTPSDIDFAEIYDAFSINPLIYAEDFGFCKKGEGGRLFEEGHTMPGGDFPVNTYGGLLSYGHTGDASGMSMIVEGALQIMGRAGKRQLSKANLTLVHSYGGMVSEHSTLILGRQS